MVLKKLAIRNMPVVFGRLLDNASKTHTCHFSDRTRQYDHTKTMANPKKMAEPILVSDFTGAPAAPTTRTCKPTRVSAHFTEKET